MAIGERREFYEHEKQPFSKFLYNGNARTVLGRNAKSWFLITIFYSVFYLFLALFFALMMAIFYQTLDTEHFPKYTPGDSSSILSNPALGFRPSPRRENAGSPLIWYKSKDLDDCDYWVLELDNFIYDYRGFYGEHLIDCSEKLYPFADKVCMFKDSYLQSCNSYNKWGYERKQPCVILKMNRMIGWIPDLFDRMDTLPFDMPPDLKEYIYNDTQNKNDEMSEMIWVSCEGESPADKENIGPIAYYPHRGFSAYYFPYMHTPGYLSPLVAVQFLKPKLHVLINIECKVWAKNINHDRANRLGLVHFELLID